jgi:hypothetical protein
MELRATGRSNNPNASVACDHSFLPESRSFLIDGVQDFDLRRFVTKCSHTGKPQTVSIANP